MAIVIDHYRAALERLGWAIDELHSGLGWKIVGVRQGQSFVYAGNDRYELWASALAFHWQPAGDATTSR
jgi:hypothetical protein